MDIEERLSLVVNEPTEEIVTIEELRHLLQTVSSPKHYIGLEISGKLHLGSLIVTGLKINDLIKAKFNTTVFLADWHTFLNNKLNSNWEKIQEIANYYKEAFKFFCPGVNVVLGSDLYQNNDQYWKNFISYCKHMSLQRTIRTLTIMGRTTRENLDLSQFLYPAMQSMDIHALDLDLVHSGTDQRKIHMLVRDIFPKLKWKVPISLHHHLLPGLLEPMRLGMTEDSTEDLKISSKMSKSKPMGSIFITDSTKTIEEKIKKAFCPLGTLENNPVLEIVKYIIFKYVDEFQIERPEKYGGTVSYDKFITLQNDYENRKIHPQDLKKSTAVYLDKVIEPVRTYLKSNEPSFE